MVADFLPTFNLSEVEWPLLFPGFPAAVRETAVGGVGGSNGVPCPLILTENTAGLTDSALLMAAVPIFEPQPPHFTKSYLHRTTHANSISRSVSPDTRVCNRFFLCLKFT